ncbi:MAG: zinc-ribbon domain-containing protein [Erysipelotrichales bacterium]|nr:zinc-ribbon domain-containing protein [Erysipelotrichales bacterium]MBQ2309473.1 zinc-ribbon domain-containing protein [Erysipelotrichales bacterium]MBQ4375595.1 zinc-ribbon domain-containing protein [Erysipelotrichales bacterium]MBQ5541521.1 zinc-ribbon domain-containing protein [Erysipelotrichales bacterium]
MNCPNCNHEVKDDEVFCPHCGLKITREPAKEAMDKTTEALHILSDADYAKQEEEKNEPEEEKPEEKKEEETAKERSILDPDENDIDSPRPPKHIGDPKAKYIYFASEDDLIVPYEYRPVTGWGFFGYSLLFILPVIGWIAAIVFAFNNHNLARKGFARMALIWLILAALTVFCLVYFKAPVIQPLVEWVLKIWPFK